jgi:hypothetical protein
MEFTFLSKRFPVRPGNLGMEISALRIMNLSL